MQLLDRLSLFFTHRAPLERGDRLLVGFSGGPDSTALLWGLAGLRARLGIELHAAHLDHALDRGSAGRAVRAKELADRLRVPLTSDRRPVERRRSRGESREAAARRVRYRFLDSIRGELDARYLVTGHHRDDQIETILLRLLHGSGLAGLAAMRDLRGSLVRPLLTIGRRELRAALIGTGLSPVADPANDDLRTPRNRVRAVLWPWLEKNEPRLSAQLLGVAEAAAGAVDRIEEQLVGRLLPTLPQQGVAVPRNALAALPRPLWPFALALLHRRAGALYPPSSAAVRDLERRLTAGGAVGCDCGGGWRWLSAGDRLILERVGTVSAAPSFAYTLDVPGELDLPEIGCRFRLTPQRVAPWMFRGSRLRAGLALDLPEDRRLTVRNRRPGDRVRPIGCSYTKRLKEVLIDRHVPRTQRDRLPLLCRGERILWVPGVTIDNDCRIERNRPVWVAELLER